MGFFAKLLGGMTPEQYYEAGEQCFDAENYAQAVEYYLKAAKSGHTKSEYSLGWCYDKGLGVSKNLDSAAHWYKIAADKGHDDAQYRLGYIFLRAGLNEQARKYFTLCHAQGHDRGMWGLTFLEYFHDNGFERARDIFWDPNASRQQVEWSVDLMQRGMELLKDSGAYLMYGVMLMLGKEPYLHPDVARGLEYYTTSARLGETEALIMLWTAYCDGGEVVDGVKVEKDPNRAGRLALEVAEANYDPEDPVSSDQLTICRFAAQAHLYGYGVPRDLQAAREWYQRIPDGVKSQAAWLRAELYP